MKPFSDDDHFYKGFTYGTRLANEGLMPVLDEETPIEELIKSIECLDRSKKLIEEFRGELSFKLMRAFSEKLDSFKERIEEVSHVQL